MHVLRAFYCYEYKSPADPAKYRDKYFTEPTGLLSSLFL